MIRSLLLFFCFFITSIAVTQKLEWERIPAYQLARPNWEEFKLDRRQYDSSLVNVLKESKKLPNFKGFNLMNPFQELPNSVGDKWMNSSVYTSSARYYMSDSNTYRFENSGEVMCFGYSSEYTSKLFKPFYFKNEEVTVREYKEFLHYVRDSIVRSNLGQEEPYSYFISGGECYSMVNWKRKLPDFRNDSNYSWILDELFNKVKNLSQKGDSIYVLKPELFNYEGWFYSGDCFSEAKGSYECLKRKVVNVLPDSMTWVRHFPYSWNEPMTMLYNWYPVYENYPAVGLNYEQVRAFLNWKETQLREKYSNKNFEISVSLPNPIEYEYAVSNSFGNQKPKAKTQENKSIFLNVGDRVKSYSLILKDSSSFYRGEKIKKEKEVNPYSIYAGNFIFDGAMHTGPVDFVSKDFPKLHVLGNGIKHLGSNVSEWMDYSFKDYKRYFDCQKTLSSSVNKKWNGNYRMVMGGNWYDEKTTLNFGAPLNSIYSKTFAHKDSAFCTVGFRYVIRVSKKGENGRGLSYISNNKTDSLSSFNIKGLPTVFVKLDSLGYKETLDSVIGKWNSREIIFVPKELEVRLVDQNVYYKDTVNNDYKRVVRGKSMTDSQEEFVRYLKPFVRGGDGFYSITRENDKVIGLYNYTLFDQGIIVLSQRMQN